MVYSKFHILSYHEMILNLLILCLIRWTYCITQELYDECYEYAEWGAWRCPGRGRICNAQYATRYRCIGGNCTAGSPCSNLKGFQEQQLCSEILEAGKCEPWWAEWSPWSLCSATCGFNERTRFRPCIGAWPKRTGGDEVYESFRKSCADRTRASEAHEVKPCPTRRLCPPINGGWGIWSDFGPCSVTCGLGVRTRTRLCNRPTPQSSGLPCEGPDIQQAICQVPHPCPRNGEWCPWSNVIRSCTEPCGPAGVGLIWRQCNCPKPLHGGTTCAAPQYTQISFNVTTVPGQGIDDATHKAIISGSAMWIPCNRHPCPYDRNINSDENLYILLDLNNVQASDTWILSGGLPARLYEPVRFSCPSYLQSRRNIFDKVGRFPNGKPYWTKSYPPTARHPYDTPSEPLTSGQGLLIEDDVIIISALTEKLSGIYRYGYEYEPGNYETLCFFPVYVKHSERRERAGSDFDLVCGVLGLWPIIKRSGTGQWFVYWEIRLDKVAPNEPKNKILWYKQLVRSKTSTPKQAEQEGISPDSEYKGGINAWDVEVRRVYDASPDISGLYECKVYNLFENGKNRTFVTQSFRLIVDPPDTIFELTYKWIVNHKKDVMVLVISTLVTTIAYSLHLWIRATNRARLEVQRIEARQKQMDHGYVAIDSRIT